VQPRRRTIIGIPLKPFAAAFAFILTVLAPAAGVESVALHMKLVNISKARAPEIFEGSIIFSLEIEARFAGVVLESEDYSVIHPFERMASGILVLNFTMPYDLPATDLGYKFVADGAWFRDPNNPAFRYDGNGMPVSVIAIPPRIKAAEDGPRLVEGNTARLKFEWKGGRSVFVTGSFNGWDPFMYPMEETAPGVYQFALPLSPGVYYYAFVANGQRYADKLNPEIAHLKETGDNVSVLRISKK
jgi:hypothetical protein